ncbi:MAG: phospho-sugar mutase [Oscillospiraceae bacterium]|nr:phospho-sugar mutase [Oscillospiraceae bacterium]
MNKEKINADYQLWKEKAVADADLVKELKEIEGNDDEILDRFYRELEFGTAGLRGVIGAGPNRMNYYTVRKATQGLAETIRESNPNPSVAIAYDSRIKSDYFSETAAEVLAGNGVKVYMYKELMPTPMLSFAVRELGCDAGINVTASHNPAKFNGYKAYGSDGCQMSVEAADAVLEKSNTLDIFTDIKSTDFKTAVEQGMVSYIEGDIIERYYEEVKKQSVHPEVCKNAGLKVVFTPLNGAGNKPVRRILKDVGITDVIVVPEQEEPDGNFPTCTYPNPEFKEALERGLKLCKEVKPDLLLATDPDCDRVGIAVPCSKADGFAADKADGFAADKSDGFANNVSDDDYVLFSGNEVGAMLLEYIARERTLNNTMPKSPIAVKSVVSSTLADEVCKEYGVQMIDVLTGFKNICEQVRILEETNEQERFIFGFEESYGYVSGTYVRDKDAVVASMLICEMAAFYRSKGISLIEARAKMYEKYGVYCNMVDNFAFEGAAGMEKMGKIMQGFRDNYPKEIAGVKVTAFSDFQTSEKLELTNGQASKINMPKTNMVIFTLEEGASVIVRPSGTEPKIKVYYTTVGKTLADAQVLQVKFAAEIKGYFD